ncbi:DNA repair protein RadC, partial [Enterococcus faecalis]|nr:DNA repair protein RadC [Enterococcus faecalis]
VAQRLLQEMKGLQQEHLICIYLNTKNDIIQQKTIFKGSLNQSVNNTMYLKFIFNNYLIIK